MKKTIVVALLLSVTCLISAQNLGLKTKALKKFESLEAKVSAWRKDFHLNPELGNREFRTAEKIASHPRQLDIEVQNGLEKPYYQTDNQQFHSDKY